MAAAEVEAVAAAVGDVEKEVEAAEAAEELEAAAAAGRKRRKGRRCSCVNSDKSHIISLLFTVAITYHRLDRQP